MLFDTVEANQVCSDLSHNPITFCCSTLIGLFFWPQWYDWPAVLSLCNPPHLTVLLCVCVSILTRFLLVSHNRWPQVMVLKAVISVLYHGLCVLVSFCVCFRCDQWKCQILLTWQPSAPSAGEGIKPPKTCSLRMPQSRIILHIFYEMIPKHFRRNLLVQQ